MGLREDARRMFSFEDKYFMHEPSLLLVSLIGTGFFILTWLTMAVLKFRFNIT